MNNKPKFNLGEMVLHGMCWWKVIGVSINSSGKFIYRLEAENQNPVNTDEDHVFGTFEEVSKIMRERVAASYERAMKAIEEFEEGSATLVKQINGTRKTKK